MKTLFTFLLFFPILAVAQVQVDSLGPRSKERIQNVSQQVDDITNYTDSLQSRYTALPQMPDSLKEQWQRVENIRHEFNSSADSINNQYQKTLNAINIQQSKIQNRIDSLQKLQLPVNKLTAKLDSLNQKKQSATNDVNSKLNALKSKTIGKLDNIEMTPGMEGPVGEFTEKINGFNLSSEGLAKLPPVELPGYSLPQIDGIGDVSSEVQKIGALGDLPKIETPLGDVSQVSGQLKGVSEDVKNIAQGNLQDVKTIPDAVEQQAVKNIDGLDELQKSTGAVDQYKEQLGDMNDPEALKKQALEMAKKEAVNHFAGKEEQLKAAMEKLSKYKQKYSSVSSIKDLPKRPPNAMKGKPFIERFIPGVYLQFQSKNAWLFDVNPYGSYKVSGKFTLGLGWNQRFAYERSTAMFLPSKRIFGPRAFVDFKLGLGFIAHLEGEAMNTFVPSTIFTVPETGDREWAWSMQLGMKKQYKIYRNLHGTVLLQYNFVNQYFKTPYVDRLNSRIGFEYVLKKRRKTSKK